MRSDLDDVDDRREGCEFSSAIARNNHDPQELEKKKALWVEKKKGERIKIFSILAAASASSMWPCACVVGLWRLDLRF